MCQKKKIKSDFSLSLWFLLKMSQNVSSPEKKAVKFSYSPK